MYFWNVRALKAELHRERLSEREGFKYVLAISFAFSVVSHLALLISEPLSNLGQIASLGSTAIAVAGTYATYATNGGARGFDFVGRYLALGWVVGCRVLIVATVVLLGVGIAVGVAEGIADPGAGESDAFLDAATAAYMLAVSATIYWRMVTHLRDLREAPEAARG